VPGGNRPTGNGRGPKELALAAVAQKARDRKVEAENMRAAEDAKIFRQVVEAARALKIQS
jgi:hypothetical protein